MSFTYRVREGKVTKGLLLSEIDVVAGYDIDESCRFSYKTNNHTTFIYEDLKDIASENVK